MGPFEENIENIENIKNQENVAKQGVLDTSSITHPNVFSELGVYGLNSMLNYLSMFKDLKTLNEQEKTQNFLAQQPNVTNLTKRQLYGDEKMYASMGLLYSNIADTALNDVSKYLSINENIKRVTDNSNHLNPKVNEQNIEGDDNILKNIKTTISKKESGNDYQAENQGLSKTSIEDNAVGKYQFYWKYHKNNIAKVTGINTIEDFKNSPEAQEKYFTHYAKNEIMPALPKLKKLAQENNLDLTDTQLFQLAHFRGLYGKNSATEMLKNPSLLYKKLESNNPSVAEYLKLKPMSKGGMYSVGEELELTDEEI